MYSKSKQNGVTLLLAILIMTAAMAVALGIFNVIYAQLQISKSASQSYKAFYSADTGKECAWYYFTHVNPQHVSGGFWDPSAPCGVIAGNCAGNLIDCGGLGPNISVTIASTNCTSIHDGLNMPSTFTPLSPCVKYTFSINNPTKIGADVEVNALTIDTSENVVVVITSQGKDNYTNASVSRTIEMCTPTETTYCPQ